MAFTLASRVSALGEAELVRAVYVPAQAKTYFVYTAKTRSGKIQFYARQLPALADLTSTAQPLSGSELLLGPELLVVGAFSCLALTTAGHVLVVYDDKENVWQFTYDFVAQSLVATPSVVTPGTQPEIGPVAGGLLLTYLRDNDIKTRLEFGSETTLLSPSGTNIYAYAAIPLTQFELRYAGAHGASTSAPLTLGPQPSSVLVYVANEGPPSAPVYSDQNLAVGPVSFAPTIPAIDPRGRAVAYATVAPLPDALSIDSSTGAISGALLAVDETKGAVQVIASNGTSYATSDTFWLFGVPAIGGARNVYVDGGTRYRTHAFLSDGTLNATEPVYADYLIVGGGGGGGMDMGGGGGGGGVVTGSRVILPGAHLMKVGGGGYGAPAANDFRTDGAGPQNSSHQYTIPATSGRPSSAFGTDYSDAYTALLLNMTGADNGTTFTDLSPYNNVISVFGNAKTSVAQSKFGGSSAAFDGSGDYLQTIPNVMTFGTEDFTVEVWVRLNAMPTSDAWPTNFSSHMVVIASGTPNLGDGFGLIIGATKLILQSNDSTPQLLSGNHGMLINTWYHIAVSRQNTTLRLFVNGVVVASTTTGAYLGTGSGTYIGSETGQGAWFNGYMQDLRVTRGLCRYTSGFVVPTAPFTYQGGVVAVGGGAGGSSYYDYTPGARGYDGASGGGASGYSNSQTRPGGRGLLGQGFSGGQGGGQYYSGGGGGAGGAGVSSTARPNGGPGVLNSILGTPYYWGGGGGGASYTLDTGGDGGIGGGGGGAVGFTTGGAGLNPGQPGGGGAPLSHADRPGGNGGENTGGGGGGGGHYDATNQGGEGGRGIIVVRYKIPVISEILGGQITTYNDGVTTYKVHTFTSTSFINGQATFVLGVLGNWTVDYLIVGGGGGGGGVIAGGGGGGGVLSGTVALTSGGYDIVVGGGGLGGFSWNSSTQIGSNGGNSSAFGVIALGGGGGGGHGGSDPRVNGSVGGSGGGGGNGVGSAGTPGQGFAGGTGDGNNGGGGGGAGGPGGNKITGSGGSGGNGIASFIRSLSGELFGGGGGGGTRSGNGIGGPGGTGGGGTGGTTDQSKTATDGLANTGGGGGGGGHNGSSSGTVRSGGDGGSGIVIIRYPIV